MWLLKRGDTGAEFLSCETETGWGCSTARCRRGDAVLGLAVSGKTRAGCSANWRRIRQVEKSS
jgi:hypothetical protein